MSNHSHIFLMSDQSDYSFHGLSQVLRHIYIMGYSTSEHGYIKHIIAQKSILVCLSNYNCIRMMNCVLSSALLLLWVAVVKGMNKII